MKSNQKQQTTIIVKGDYVQEKHVDYQIGDIASGGIGVMIGVRPLESERTSSQAAHGENGGGKAAEVHNTPYENDYVALVEWLAVEKEQGRDWYRLNNHNRSAMCRQLTEQLGWVVDQNSLLKAQERLTR